MGLMKESFDWVYAPEPLEESERVVDEFSELLPGFEEALAFQRASGPLGANPLLEVATPLRPLEFMNCLIR